MHVVVKTHKADNPVRIITSGCSTVVEKLSVLVEKTNLLANRFNSKIKDSDNMLEIIDETNRSMLSENCVLLSFDVVKMFPNIDSKYGLISVKEALTGPHNTGSSYVLFLCWHCHGQVWLSCQ